jgi:hypothetical protein
MTQIQSMKYSHDAMVDVMVANPSIRQKELAAMFGRSDAWISIVIASDVFQLKLAERKSELVDPTIKEEIEARFKVMTRRSLEVLQDKLNQPSSVVDAGFALKAAELGMKGMGIGQPQPTVVVDGGDRIGRLASRLEGLLGPAVKVFPQVEVVDVPSREV